MADATIRAANPADAATVRRVARESWHAAYDDILGANAVDETVDEWYDPDGLRESAADPDHDFLVAERAEIVGFVHVAPIPDEANVALLVRIYVVPSEWGTGLGTRLLERAERRLRDRGVERLRLSVFADNEVGVAFYDSRGFERVEEREAEGFGVRECVYEKAL
ncbi:GNAT family N-acetyltransferase [Haladaptatus salinisoli]|uniref:GNAT family N-acetyltransferase n=1 Tax=Haladaptatus salinisoli TaxID=2884876 RepID=UPI001D0B7078|nr:GNAT family N-acetyltransferase [Haladaptatus salinisoli]